MRYDAVLLPFISIVRSPGRPGTPVPDFRNPNLHIQVKQRDAAFLLTVGASYLQLSVFACSCVVELFGLQLELFYLQL